MDSTAPFQPWAKDGAKNVKSERELVDDAKLHQENVNHPKHTQTASYDKDSISASSEDPGPSSAADPDVAPLRDKESGMDSGKIASMQQFIENTLSHEGRQRVAQLLEEVEALSGAERLLLYLRLPTGIPPHDPLKQPINPLGSRAELQQTVTWIQTHLEVDPDVSLPKQDVYDEYIAHCMSSNMKPLSTADFGKVMKQVYPSVRPRRLGTRGNSRYCYAGLRKKIKLEVPQLPDLGDSSKESRDMLRETTDRTVLNWAESKLGVKLTSMLELSRHLSSLGAASRAPPAQPSHTPPPLASAHGYTPEVVPLSPSHDLMMRSQGNRGQPSNFIVGPAPSEDPTSRQLMKQLKRKIQTQGTPGRSKKNKGVEVSGESPPSISYPTHGGRGAQSTHVPHGPVKHESEPAAEPGYHYQPAYVYESRPPSFPPYAAPPRAHPPPAPHPAIPSHDYRPEAYVFEPPYVPRDLTLPPDATHNLPINLSSDASLDLSTERTDWQRRRPPEPPPTPAPARLHLPGKKLILETYQSETQASTPRPAPAEARAPPPLPPHAPDDFPRAEYLPKKMRAAEILGGKLSSARQALAVADAAAASASTSGTGVVSSVRSEVAFLEDPKNVSSRSKSTAAALAREQQEAASPTQSVKAPTPKCERTRLRRPATTRSKGNSPEGAASPERPATPDSCCGLDGINIKTGMICEEKHSEILNRERVISICNIDKHALDDYLNEGNSQEHEEELLQYFHHRDADPQQSAEANTCDNTTAFLEAGLDPQDEHSQGKNEKISQLRELLAKNLKNQSGSSSQSLPLNKEGQLPQEKVLEPVDHSTKSTLADGAFKPVLGTSVMVMNGPAAASQPAIHSNNHCGTITNGNGTPGTYLNQGISQIPTAEPNLYNGNSHNIPQSPTTRTQQYDFVPISDGCHSPGNFHTKSPVGFVHRGHSPFKVNKPVMMMGGSLQTSPTSHSTAASPFVSPRNTPVPRSKLCPRPIPKLNGRKRRNPLTLGVGEPNSKLFAIPNDQKFFYKTSLCGPNAKYCQPMSAPPSPNILSSQYKSHMFHSGPGVSNGPSNLHLNFLPNAPFKECANGDAGQPLSADPLASEVSQFFQESLAHYRAEHDASFRSQSAPLKQLGNLALLNYMHTPVGSVPPTPVPNEFCDFGSLADTCDISKAGLNPETLDKIYDAIDSSNNVLNSGAPPNLLSSSNSLSNGCDPLPDQQILTDEQLNSLIPSGGELLSQPSNQFNHSFPEDSATSADNVEDFLKRAHSIEFDLSELVDKSKYYTSRSVPSTPLPFKRAVPNLQIDSRRSRELFSAVNYPNASNGISSKSVPSTPQLGEERSVFSYSNRDFLINGNSVEACAALPPLDGHAGLASPLHMLREELLEPLPPAAELLADLDKIGGPPYVDL